MLVKQPFEWQQPGAPLTLPDGQVHIWKKRLAEPDCDAAQLAQTLSVDERARAARLPNIHAQKSKLAARGWLRSILSLYLQEDACQLLLDYGPWGKPFIYLPGSRICFNLAHTDDMLVAAFTRNRTIGIDLERVRPMSGRDYLTRFIFSDREQEWFASLSPQEQETALINVWTQKEAFLKALGIGLTVPMNSFPVQCDPHLSMQTLVEVISTHKTQAYRTYQFIPQEDYLAAVVIEGKAQLEFAFWETTTLLYQAKPC